MSAHARAFQSKGSTGMSRLEAQRLLPIPLSSQPVVTASLKGRGIHSRVSARCVAGSAVDLGCVPWFHTLSSGKHTGRQKSLHLYGAGTECRHTATGCVRTAPQLAVVAPLRRARRGWVGVGWRGAAHKHFESGLLHVECVRITRNFYYSTRNKTRVLRSTLFPQHEQNRAIIECIRMYSIILQLRN